MTVSDILALIAATLADTTLSQDERLDRIHEIFDPYYERVVPGIRGQSLGDMMIPDAIGMRFIRDPR